MKKMCVTAGVHLIAVVIVSFLLGVFLLPPASWAAIFDVAQSTDAEVLTLLNIATHVVVSATCWVFLLLVFAVVNDRSKKVVKPATGSVMVETLVIMPLFLLLTFGMGQLSINNIASILGNVAVYQAARTAWIWMPEELVDEKRQNVLEGTAVQKARTAAAMVMLPAAPGDYFLGELDGEETKIAEKARLAAGAAHIPGGGLATGALGDDIAELVSLGSQGTAGVTGNPLDYLSFTAAVDRSNFISRTLSKFSFAYNSTTIEIDEETLEVTMTYLHFQGMPYVGRVFGEKKWFDGPTLRPGYYAEIKRTYGFQKQANLPNAAMPNNQLLFIPEPPVSDSFYGGIE